MLVQRLFIAAAVVVAGIAAWTDWRRGQIPNWLTLGALAVAPFAHLIAALATGRSGEAIEAAGFSVVGAAACGLVPVLLYRAGGIYGGDVNFPIYFDEKNNPSFNGQPANGFCIDRNA